MNRHMRTVGALTHVRRITLPFSVYTRNVKHGDESVNGDGKASVMGKSGSGGGLTST